MIKKIMMCVFLTSSCAAAELQTVSSGYALGAFVDCEYYKDGTLVDKTPDNADTDYNPAENTYPTPGSLSAGGSATAYMPSLVYDPNNINQFAYATATIFASWTPLTQERNSPYIKLTSSLETLGNASTGNRVGLMTASTSGTIFRIFNRPAGTSLVSGYITMSGSAANPAGDHDIILMAYWGDNYVKAVYNKSVPKWTITQRVKGPDGNWLLVGGVSPYSYTVNGRTFTVNQPAHTLIGSSSYTMSSASINRIELDPRGASWKYEDHFLANSVVSSQSNMGQAVSTEDEVSVEVIAATSVAAE